MTKVNQDPFSNGEEQYIFEQHNCRLCTKSSKPCADYPYYINMREDGMPTCDIQRDIYVRMISDEPIDQRTVDICNDFIMHGTVCPSRMIQEKKGGKQ